MVTAQEHIHSPTESEEPRDKPTGLKTADSQHWCGKTCAGEMTAPSIHSAGETGYPFADPKLKPHLSPSAEVNGNMNEDLSVELRLMKLQRGNRAATSDAGTGKLSLDGIPRLKI